MLNGNKTLQEEIKVRLVNFNIAYYANQKLFRNKLIYNNVRMRLVGLGGLGVTCSARDPSFTGSNPTENDGIFQDVKILSTSPPGGTLSWESRV